MKIGKRIILLLVLCFIVCGCSNFNNSPESVSKEMMKRLSNANYENIEELLYLKENAFVSDSSFKQYLERNSINLEGIKDYKYLKTEELGGNTYVYFDLGNNKRFKINTVQNDDKWYISLDNEYDEDLIIKVPTGAKVKLDNKILDYKKYAKTEQDSLRVNYSYSPEINVDVYTIPYIFSGEYNLVVEIDNAEKINQTINSDKYYFSPLESDEKYFANRSDEYLLKMIPASEFKSSIEDYITKFYNNMFESVNNNKEFNDVNHLEKAKKEYNKLLNSKEEIGSYSEKRRSNFRLNKINFDDIYYYGDENIIIKYSVEFVYNYEFKYTNFMASMDKFNENKENIDTMSSSIQIEKTKDGFNIKSGYDFIPEV